MKKNSVIGIFIILLLFVGISLDRIVSFIVNIQWYKEVGYVSVYFTKIVATLQLMVPLFIISYLGIWLYYKSLRANMMKIKKVVEVNTRKRKIEKNIFIGSNILISFLISYGVSSNYWYRILQFGNATSFGIKDPIFNKDISFYVFKLPLIESLYGAAMVLLVFLVFITLITYFLMNAKDRMSSMDIKNPFANVSVLKSEFTKFAGKQLATMAALFMFFLSFGYLIKAWNLVYSPRGVAYGASYTDIHVTLRFYYVIMVVALIAAVVIFISVITSKPKPIIISIVVIVTLVLGEGITSSLVQRFIVKSNEKSFEEKYIKYNIEYTRKGFNIDTIEERPFDVKNNLTKEDLQANKDTINNIRVNSFKPALEFYNQVQVIRYYYGFNDIDIDRYNVNGKYNQVFIAPREINLQSLEGNASTWQNRHLVYTHGYGVVMSKVNSVTSEGQPDFVIKDIPPDNSSGISLKNPRIYFGEKTNEYAIVNSKQNEFDYPKGGDNQFNQYDGKAGIPLGFLNKVLFSLNQRDLNFMLSRDITDKSKILINRNIEDRVRKIAPFLTYDQDPYIVIHNDRLYWVIDAYTVSDRYPFSQPQDGVNYIRNSIKVVVDASDGITNFYIIDKNDPIAKSYAKIFPDLFKDQSSIPAGIMEHLRYPTDMFNLQCNVLGKYHMTEPGIFYNAEDLWEVAKNQKKVEGETETNEGSYVVMKLPEEKTEEMVLLEYFNMRNKDNMAAIIGARMDKENYGKLVAYKLPTQKTIYSPYLFKQKLNQDTTISKELSLWNKQGSEVIFGDTMIVPIHNSLLYVEPLYLRAQGKNSIPEMKRVIVSYAEKIVIAENIENALEQIFNFEKEKVEIPQNNPNTTITTKNDIKLKAKEAQDLFQKAIESQKSGDWSKYGEYIKKLEETLNELNK